MGIRWEKIQTTKYKFAQILSFHRSQNIKLKKNPFDSIFRESLISRSVHDITKITKMSSKKQIYYSDKYTDEEFEYRHVMLPKDLAKMVPKTHLMSETWSPTKSGMGALHDSRSRTSYSSVQEAYSN